jgi:hypothetical protein
VGISVWMNYFQVCHLFLGIYYMPSVVTWIPTSVFNTQFELCALSNGIRIGTLLKSLALS